MGSRSEPIPIFADLKFQAESRPGGRQGRVRAKMTVEVTTPNLVFSADEGKLAKDVAKAIALTIQTNMLGGYKPDGSGPLPAVSESTAERRWQRREQAHRGGEAHPRWKSPTVRRIIKKNWLKRFRAPSLGEFNPNRYGQHGWRGVESGMLAFSAKAVPQDGHWTIYFANPRGTVERGGMSAVARVFSLMPVWTHRSMMNPHVQKALRDFRDQLFASRLRRIGQGLVDLQSDVRETAETAKEAG